MVIIHVEKIKNTDMKTNKNISYRLSILICLLVGLPLFYGCNDSGFARDIPKDDIDISNASTPNVTIYQVAKENITGTSVNIDAAITSDGGARVIKSGICWDTQPNPTIDGINSTSNGPTLGKIPGFIGGLSYETEYFVRAYAENPVGISYSDEISFTTMQELQDKIFLDDFDRDDLGSYWKVHAGQFQIEDNALFAATSGHLFYENEEAKIVSGDGHMFKLETDFYVDSDASHVFGGIIFNAQNRDEFYFIRIGGDGTFQFLATDDGVLSFSGVFVVEPTTTLIGRNLFRLELTSTTAGIFHVKIKNGEQVVYENTIEDPEARYESGYVGYYSFGGNCFFDNFSLYIN
jgi:hypothetical protein